jgi:lauroyl/myristoyl acyltransferase
MFVRQRGATFLGMVIILAIVGCGVYAGIRLTPIYFEYMAVARATEQSREDAVRDALVRINARLEDWIRERPGQWLWMHKRWPKEAQT